MTKLYRLIGVDGVPYWSERKGTLGGNRYGRYGRLDCPAALQALGTGDTYSRGRVFFADEASAVAAGYRPCGTCMPARYRAWRTERHRKSEACSDRESVRKDPSLGRCMETSSDQ